MRKRIRLPQKQNRSHARLPDDVEVGDSPIRLIRPGRLAELLGLSQATIWQWRKSGVLPEAVRLGDRLFAWRESDIARWLEARTDRSR
jgi:prophage regulatory protein